jgi:hypothetical protein
MPLRARVSSQHVYIGSLTELHQNNAKHPRTLSLQAVAMQQVYECVILLCSKIKYSKNNHSAICFLVLHYIMLYIRLLFFLTRVAGNKEEYYRAKGTH